VNGRRGILIGLVVMVGLLSSCSRPSPPPVRDTTMKGLWITRWDYRTEQDVDRCLADAARLGVTDVFFQVRGQADAFYRSDLEPWGHQLEGDPGYDPLARAIGQAHRRNLRLHAWVNVYPLWKGTELPTSLDHALRLHPSWRLHDQDGSPQPLNDHYVVANPTLPEVQDHIATVLVDICTRYAVDGLHLDYIRFVSDRLDEDKLWPGDSQSQVRWRSAGGEGDPMVEPGRSAYRAWIREEISNLVARLSRECRPVRPRLMMSAAVWRDPNLGRDGFLQDGARWLQEGWMDRVLPMIYTRDVDTFITDLQAWKLVAPADQIVPGLGVYKQEAGDLSPQLDQCTGTGGWSLFAYGSFFNTANPDQDRSPAAQQRRQDLRTELSGD